MPRDLRLLVGLALGALGTAAAPLAAQTPLHRVNCGGPALVAGGAAFTGDVPYAGTGSSGFVGGAAVQVVSNAQYVGGWQDPHKPLHADGREGFTAYRLPVHVPEVIVRLHLAEIVLHGPQLRRFGLAVEGVPVGVDLDLAALHGIQYGAVLAARVPVSGGVVDVEPLPGGDPALLDAIEVWSLPASFPAPAPVAGLSALGSHRRILLTWEGGTDPLIEGYAVSRASSAAGPFAPAGTSWASPPRWIDEDVPSGETRFYRVAALDLAGQQGPPSATVSATSLDPALSSLRSFEILITPEDQKTIDELVLTDPKLEVPAVLVTGGVPRDVEVRYRGQSSRRHSKKSWKVKFPGTAPFEGQLDLNFKAHFADGSLTREALTLDLLRSLGHPAVEREPVQLLVNGRWRGVFNSVEQIERDYLEARDRDPGGSIYECNSNFSLPVDPVLFPEFYTENYEKKTNEATGHDDLIELLQLLDVAPAQGLDLALARVLDVDDYLGYLAVITLLADFDTIRHNAYLLHDHSLERWELISWDHDATWGLDPSTVTLPIDFGTLPAMPSNQLKSRVLEAPAFRWRFSEKLAALVDLAEGLDGEIDGKHAAIAADGAVDPFKLGWESDAPLQGAPALQKAFLAARSAFLAAALPGYQPASPPTPVWINELMADNAAGAVDEQGEHADWVELHNASAGAVDVGGWHLTDDLSNPTKWAFPAGTTIPAGGRLLVWADGETAEGPLHAAFSLSKSGEALGLFAADGETLLDFIHFRPQRPDISYGRAVDGGPFWRPLATPTPGAPNTAAGNLPPLITWLEHSPAVVGAGDEVVVSCKVADDDGLLSVTLLVSLGGGPSVPQPMSPDGPLRWKASIGRQPAGTQVSCTVQAVDGLGLLGEDPPLVYTVAAPSDSPLRISEILADNENGLTDEAGEHEDWVEIHNSGSTAADLSGLHLTDNFSNPTKWTFPAGTTLAPGAHLLVWADEDAGDGPLHAAFKLGAGGEQVGLFAAGGGTLLHGFAFGPQQEDVSLGAMPDDSLAQVSLLVPSPGAPNAPAQGAHASFDAGNTAANGISLAAAGEAAGGQSFSYHVAGAPGFAPGALLVGIARQQVPAGASGTLLLDALLLLPFAADGLGAAAFPLLVPPDPVLDGVLIYCQPIVKPGGLGNAVATRLDSV